MGRATTRRKVDDQRKRVFLETLERTGSVCAAARAATPWAQGERGGVSSFRHAMRDDPEFAAAVEDARSAALGRVEETIAERAVDGWQRPVYQKGELVGFETCHDNNLLLRLAARLDPDAWSDRRRLEHSGTVEQRGVVLAITPADVLRLGEGDQRALVDLLGKIADAKDGDERLQELPPPPA